MEGDFSSGFRQADARVKTEAEKAAACRPQVRPVVHHLRQVHLEDASQDTIDCLRQLLRDAELGKVVGIAYIALHRDRSHSRHACGEAFEDPIYSSGLLGLLDSDLQALA